MQPVTRIILGILSVIHVITLGPACFAAVVFLFSDPPRVHSMQITILVVAAVTLPLLIIGCMVGAWALYSYKKYTRAIIVMLLPWIQASVGILTFLQVQSLLK